jgi:hypothetical protein
MTQGPKCKMPVGIPIPNPRFAPARLRVRGILRSGRPPDWETQPTGPPSPRHWQAASLSAGHGHLTLPSGASGLGPVRRWLCQSPSPPSRAPQAGRSESESPSIFSWAEVAPTRTQAASQAGPARCHGRWQVCSMETCASGRLRVQAPLRVRAPVELPWDAPGATPGNRDHHHDDHRDTPRQRPKVPPQARPHSESAESPPADLALTGQVRRVACKQGPRFGLGLTRVPLMPLAY